MQLISKSDLLKCMDESEPYDEHEDCHCEWLQWRTVVARFPSISVKNTVGRRVKGGSIMDKNDRLTAPSRAIEKWGKEAQIRQCMEECAELIQALNKYLRAEGSKDIYLTEEAMVHARKEMADVSVMLDQMEEIFGDSWGEYLAATDHLVKLLADGKDEQ